MKLSCAFATSMDTPRHIEVAEELGYERAWVYDSPALYPDAWMTLALAAGRTSTITIGPAVLVPSLRHPMTNAAAIATLEALAPGRVAIAIGSGFTGRYTLGQKPLRWADVESYVVALRGLLAGQTVDWEGAPIRMLHGTGYGAERPIELDLLIGADGPKGTAVAERVANGIFAAGVPNAHAAPDRPHVLLQFGTVLADQENLRSQRVADAAGHAIAVLFHAIYERGGRERVVGFPGGEQWADAIESIPARERHLSTHEGHLVRLSPFEEKAVMEAADMLPDLTFTGTPQQIRGKIADYEASGVTEIAYQPAGQD
ncbi:MAG: 5,10-methylene tetrahydromethanopterin reductase, partial [Actinobacteria bacterium]